MDSPVGASVILCGKCRLELGRLRSISDSDIPQWQDTLVDETASPWLRGYTGWPLNEWPGFLPQHKVDTLQPGALCDAQPFPAAACWEAPNPKIAPQITVCLPEMTSP